MNATLAGALTVTLVLPAGSADYRYSDAMKNPGITMIALLEKATQ